MKERIGTVSMGGKPLTLVGEWPGLGSPAPDFEVVDNDLQPIRFSQFRGKICILSSVPSLDTPVCDLQTRRFNEDAVRLGPQVEVLTLSMDLPFAQKRWCGDAGVQKVRTLSDHRKASFGIAYGVLIKELRLLARAVFVVDKDGILRYRQIVEDLTKEPDYGACLEAVRRCRA